MADTKLQLDATEVFAVLDKYDQRLEQIEKGYADVGKAAQKSGKDASNAFAPEGSGAKQHAAEIDRLQKEYVDLKKAADTLKTALRTAYDPRAIVPYTKALKDAESGMKRLEQVGDAVGVNLKKVGKEGTLAAQVVSQAFGAITKATVILAIIDQVVKLTKTAVALSVNLDKAKKSFTALTGSAETASILVSKLSDVASKNLINTENIFQAGQSLLAFGESAERLPDVLDRISIISRATGKDFNDLAVIYGKARTSGVLFAEDINQLVDAGIPIIKEFAKQFGVSESNIKKLASEGKISFEELQLAFFNLSKEGTAFANLAVQQANTLPGLWAQTTQKIKPYLTEVGDFFSGVLRYGLFQVNQYLDSFDNLINGRTKKLKSLDELDASGVPLDVQKRQKAALVFAIKKSEEELRLEKEAADKRAELDKQNGDKRKKQAEQYAKDLADARLRGMRDGEEKELAEENLRFQRLFSELRKFHLNTKEAEEQHQINLFLIREKYDQQRLQRAADLYTKILELEQKQIDAEKKTAEDLANTRLEAIEQANSLRNLDVDLAEENGRNLIAALRRSGASEAKIKEAQRILDLNLQKARLESELAFQSALISTVENGEDGRLGIIVKNIDLLKAKIAGINQEIGSVGGEGGNKPKSLIELLGFEKGSIEDQALQDTVGKIKQALDDITQARIAAADEQRRLADDNVQQAQDALDVELERQKDGFANYANERRADLEDAKKVQAEAIEEQRKAARQRALIDTATQISSLITAGVQYFSAHASIPFVGIALAIGAIATMLSSISRLKATAKSSFREGGSGFIENNGFVHGKSHAEGGNHLEIERGELFQVAETGGRKRVSVVKRERVAEYMDLLDAVNSGDKRAISKHAYALSGMEVDRAAISKRVFSSTATPVSEKNDLAQLEKIVERIYQEMKKDKPSFSDDGKTKRTGQGVTYYRK